jgi:hypothetical protein
VKKRRLGPQNGPESLGPKKLLKIVSCQKTVLSQLEKVGGHRDPPVTEELPPLDEEGQLILILEDVLEVVEKRLRNRSIKEYLIKWKNLPIEDASWEGEHVLQHIYSELLVGKQFQAGETVRSPSN